MGKFSTIISPYSSGSAENLPEFFPEGTEGQIFLDNPINNNRIITLTP